MDHLSQLPYLEAVVHETLRLEPIVAVTRRGAVQDVVLDDGLLVKKGWSCYIAQSAMARNPAAWGPDAELFKPERWLTKDSPLLAS
jgi:cytochrome P450